MNANLKILSSSIPNNAEEALSHRSAAKVYVFFVHWIWTKMDVGKTDQAALSPKRRNTRSASTSMDTTDAI